MLRQVTGVQMNFNKTTFFSSSLLVFTFFSNCSPANFETQKESNSQSRSLELSSTAISANLLAATNSSSVSVGSSQQNAQQNQVSATPQSIYVPVYGAPTSTTQNSQVNQTSTTVSATPTATTPAPTAPPAPVCNSQDLGYALCPVKPALLANGRLSTSTILSVYSRNQVLASAGNFVVVRNDQGQMFFKTVDQSGVIVGNGAPLLNPAEVAIAIVRSGLYQSSDWRAKLRSIAQQLDNAGIVYRPFQVYSGSSIGIDIMSLADGGFGAPYDWSSDELINCKGPTALKGLKNEQIAAKLLNIAGANSSLLGRNVPSYVSQALGDGPGGVVCYNLNQIAGLNNSMLTSAGGIVGSLTTADTADFFSGYFDLYKNAFLPL